MDKYIITVKLLAGADPQAVNSQLQGIISEIDAKESYAVENVYALAGGTGYVITLDAADASCATMALMALTMGGKTTATVSHVMSTDAYGGYLVNPLGNKK